MAIQAGSLNNKLLMAFARTGNQYLVAAVLWTSRDSPDPPQLLAQFLQLYFGKYRPEQNASGPRPAAGGFSAKAALVDKKIKRASGRGAREFPAEGLTISLAILGP